MRRTTITLPEDLADAIEREAHRRRKTVSATIREVLAREFHCEPGEKREIPWAGIARRGHPWSAVDLDEELERTWVDDIKRGWRD